MPATQTRVHFKADPSLSRFTVRAFAGGMLSAFGHNPTIAIRDFSADASFVAGTLDQADLVLKIAASSLELADDVSERDKRELERTMREEVLQISKYPQIVFESASIRGQQRTESEFAVEIDGTLTLHGVSRQMSLTARVAVFGNQLRAFGEFPLLQSEFGIKPVSFAAGTLRLKDEVKLSFDIVARKVE